MTFVLSSYANKNCIKDMIRINCTSHPFQKQNMRTEISNMRNIHEIMLLSGAYVFCDPMITVLIQKTSFFKCVKSLKVDAFWQKLADNYMKNYSQFRWRNSRRATEFRFWIGCQNLADRLILSAKVKNFRKSSIKKINIPSSFVFQSEASKVTIQRKK